MILKDPSLLILSTINSLPFFPDGNSVVDVIPPEVHSYFKSLISIKSPLFTVKFGIERSKSPVSAL